MLGAAEEAGLKHAYAISSSLCQLPGCALCSLYSILRVSGEDISWKPEGHEQRDLSCLAQRRQDLESESWHAEGS